MQNISLHIFRLYNNKKSNNDLWLVFLYPYPYASVVCDVIENEVSIMVFVAVVVNVLAASF